MHNVLKSSEQTKVTVRRVLVPAPYAYIQVTVPCGKATREHTITCSVYFLPLRLLGPSLPEASPPLVSASLVMVPFFVFFKWCSGIHSSSYPPELVAAMAAGALTSGGTAALGFLDLGKNERKVRYPAPPTIPKTMRYVTHLEMKGVFSH